MNEVTPLRRARRARRRRRVWPVAVYGVVLLVACVVTVGAVAWTWMGATALGGGEQLQAPAPVESQAGPVVAAPRQGREVPIAEPAPRRPAGIEACVTALDTAEAGYRLLRDGGNPLELARRYQAASAKCRAAAR